MFEYATSVTGFENKNAHRLLVPQVHTNYGKQNCLKLTSSLICLSKLSLSTPLPEVHGEKITLKIATLVGHLNIQNF